MLFAGTLSSSCRPLNCELSLGYVELFLKAYVLSVIILNLNSLNFKEV